MKIVLNIIAFIIIGVVGWYVGKYVDVTPPPIFQTPTPTPVPTPLAKYTIENLSATKIEPGTIKITETLDQTTDEFTASLFEFEFKPEIAGETKVTTGQINVPTAEGKFPIVVMLRGYVDQTIYETGIGTRRAAAEFAKNGLVTISPDFLGYAGSDREAGDIFETRFQTYTTVLSLLASLDQVERWDGENIFIWGHSNGGHLALAVLEITSGEYPTTLWAPVSVTFPYSVLYYTNESEDKGKLIRRELANFEKIYDTNLYDITGYFEKIKAPVQIHQGTADDAVPQDWSVSLDKLLALYEVESKYFVYPGADHNLDGSWEEVVARDLQFFRSHL